MLWLLMPIVMGFLFNIGDKVPVLHNPSNPLFVAVDVLLVSLIFAAPIIMFIVTWRWLSGKEKPPTH